MVEVWLSDSRTSIRLPVLPEKITLSTGAEHEKVTLQALGEVLLPGKRRLRSMSLQSFFPKRYNSYCQYRNIPDPAAASKACLDWAEAGTVLRLVITGGAMAVNLQVILEEYSSTMGKVAGDVEYTMAMSEYRQLLPVQADSTAMAERQREIVEPPVPPRKYYTPPKTIPPVIIKQSLNVPLVLQKYPAVNVNQTV